MTLEIAKGDLAPLELSQQTMAGAHPRFAEELLNAHPSGSRLLSEPLMLRSRKIDLEKVQASLDKKCPKCGFTVTPDLVKRVDFERIQSQVW